jgi:hypothetical protein
MFNVVSRDGRSNQKEAMGRCDVTRCKRWVAISFVAVALGSRADQALAGCFKCNGGQCVAATAAEGREQCGAGMTCGPSGCSWDCHTYGGGCSTGGGGSPCRPNGCQQDPFVTTNGLPSDWWSDDLRPLGNTSLSVACGLTV